MFTFDLLWLRLAVSSLVTVATYSLHVLKLNSYYEQVLPPVMEDGQMSILN